MSEKTTTTCAYVCVGYLCPVNYDDKNENKRVYAMGSGCREDVRKNCEFYIDFSVKNHTYVNTSIMASVCVNQTGSILCRIKLDALIAECKHDFPKADFGWDHYYDMEWEPDVEGVGSTW
uniref:Uncharacterized protein n=1 Tax=Panagrolaimus sp. ES5 TaxID=591445 RepID=A0AC34G9B3_9BILA